MRRQIELFELPPELPDRLCSPLCAENPLTRSVGTQQLQLVKVDRGPLGADGDRNEVTVPGCQLLQLGQKLLALRSAGRPPDALLRIPRGEIELGDRSLFALTRLALAIRTAAASEGSKRSTR